MLVIDPSPLAMRTPQLHSHDAYLRVPAERLSEIVLQHLFSAQDVAVLADADPGSAVRAGMTEWQGPVAGRVASLGWDWVQSADGALRVLRRLRPRTNLCLIDPQGYDLAPDQAEPLIWTLIEALPWQLEVRRSLPRNSEGRLH